MNQLDIEQKYNKRALVGVIAEEYAALIAKYVGQEEETLDLLYVLMQKSIQPIQNAVSLLANRGHGWEEAVQILDRRSEDSEPLYQLVVNDSGHITVNSLKRPTAAVVEAQRHMGVLPPMVEKPLDWTNHMDGGYLTQRHTAILGAKNQHDKWINLAALNKLQSIPWKLNQAVLENFHDEHVYSEAQAQEVYGDMWGKEFYFMWNYDSGGRMYSKSYECNPQGTSYQKALLDFAEGEYLTKEGADELLMAIAGCVDGGDKLNWDERLKLGKALVVQRTSLNQDDEWDLDLEGVEEPEHFLKYIHAYMDYEEGKKVYTPIHQDATASGLGIMSCLTGCKKTAEAVNLINTGNREDVYTYFSKAMNGYLEAVLQVSRKDTKKPLMCYYYGSKAVPREAFSEGQLAAFYVALDGQFPGPERFMKVVEAYRMDKETYVFTLPDGHKAVIKTHVLQTATIELAEGVEFEYDYATHMPTGDMTHLYARMIHAVDAWVARQMVLRCEFPVATIHDSFQCMANETPRMREVYREIMAELAESDLLSSMLSELAGKPITFEKESEDLADEIRNSNYAIC